MSLFEWWGESRNPGPRGSLSFEKPSHHQGPTRGDVHGPTRGDVLARFIFAVTIVGVIAFFLVMTFPAIVDHAAVGLGIFAAYLVLSYFARPEPDTSNVGWFGGLMDDPFRYSDDINRWLFFLKIVLLPGRFISEAIVEFLYLFRRS